ARNRNGTRMVEDSSLDLFGELNSVARAFDIGGVLALRAGCKVVDRAKVEEMLDLAFERLAQRWAYAEAGLGQVTAHRDQAFAFVAETVAQRLELGLRPLAHETVNIAFAREQFRYQMLADETRRP